VLLASACLPLTFQAVEIEGDPYWDGGYMGNPALYPLIEQCEGGDIVIVQIDPLTRDAPLRSASEILNRLNEITMNASLNHELHIIAFVQKLAYRRGNSREPGMTVWLDAATSSSGTVR
jgi:NTE family protein